MYYIFSEHNEQEDNIVKYLSTAKNNVRRKVVLRLTILLTTTTTAAPTQWMKLYQGKLVLFCFVKMQFIIF